MFRWIKKKLCRHNWYRDKGAEIMVFYFSNPSHYEGKKIIRCNKCLDSKIVDKSFESTESGWEEERYVLQESEMELRVAIEEILFHFPTPIDIKVDYEKAYGELKEIAKKVYAKFPWSETINVQEDSVSQGSK